MWFKNISIYRLKKPLELDVIELDELLSGGEFQPCHKTQLTSVGWWKPLGKGSEMFTHASGSCLMICRRIEEKEVPVSAINLRIEEVAEKIEEKECRKVSRKERDIIKEDVMKELLPLALVNTRLIYAYFDFKNNYLVVNTASDRESEALISHLRQTLGTFPVVPLQVNKIIEFTLTTWLKAKRLPDGLVFGHSCKLASSLMKADKVSFSSHSLTGQDIEILLEEGMDVVQMELNYRDRIDFKIEKMLKIKGVSFSDVVKESAQDAEDKYQQFDIDFSLMTLEIESLIKYLINCFGGVRESVSDEGEQMEIIGLHNTRYSEADIGLNMDKIAESGDPVDEFQRQAIEYVLRTGSATVEGIKEAMECSEIVAKGFILTFQRIGFIGKPDGNGKCEVLK